MNIFSLDVDIFQNRKSIFVVRVKGKKKRLNLISGDLLVVDKSLPLKVGRLAVLVIKEKFYLDLVSKEFLKKHDPENGDFIWGMVKTVVRELK